MLKNLSDSGSGGMNDHEDFRLIGHSASMNFHQKSLGAMTEMWPSIWRFELVLLLPATGEIARAELQGNPGVK